MSSSRSLLTWMSLGVASWPGTVLAYINDAHRAGTGVSHKDCQKELSDHRGGCEAQQAECDPLQDWITLIIVLLHCCATRGKTYDQHVSKDGTQGPLSQPLPGSHPPS